MMNYKLEDIGRIQWMGEANSVELIYWSPKSLDLGVHNTN